MFRKKRKAPDKLPSLGIEEARLRAHVPQEQSYSRLPTQQPAPHPHPIAPPQEQAPQHPTTQGMYQRVVPSQEPQHPQDHQQIVQSSQSHAQTQHTQHYHQELPTVQSHAMSHPPAQPLSAHTQPSVEQAQRPLEQEQSGRMLLQMKKKSPEEEENGYFKQLIKSVTEENEDVEKLSSWYENKFLPNDIVFQMREYWEKQQPELMLKQMRGDLKRELADKTERLHGLEGEWQEIYFKLLAKEDEIRREERALKDTLNEFMGAFKHSLKERQKNEK